MPKNVLDKIEYWHNRASDTKFVWFPFERQRPALSERIGVRRVIVMSISFGIYYGIYSFVRGLLLFGETFDLHRAQRGTLFAILAFFVWFSTVTSYFWNRRAKRLSQNVGVLSQVDTASPQN